MAIPTVELVARQERWRLPEGELNGKSKIDQSGRSEKSTQEFTLPPPIRGRDQLQAMLHRQWLHKRRGWQQSIIELLSPLLMMTLLVWAWSRSTEDHFKAQIYANSSLPILSILRQDLLSNSKSLFQLCPADMLAHQGLSPEELAILTLEVRQSLEGLTSPSLSNITTNKGIIPLSSTLAALTLKCVDSAKQVSTALQAFNAYHGPSPVPSFDAFVQAHKLLQQTLKSGKGQQYEELLRVQRMFGNLLGNLIALGHITFAPDSSEVRGLVKHLNDSTELNMTTKIFRGSLKEGCGRPLFLQYFQEVYGGIFPSEQEAVKSALTSTRFKSPTWAIIVVNHLDPVGGNVDYKIRMNFTTVPSTWDTLHKKRKGLLTYYKHYYTSGFLSLQDAVNSYVLKTVPTHNESSLLTEKPMWGAPFPTTSFTRNKFYRHVGPLLGLMLCLTTLYPLGMFVKGMVEEKETRVKETMHIMGLKSWVFYLSWLMTYLVVFLVISISLTTLLSFTVFPRSDPSLLFVIFFSFTISLIAFGLFLSVFFSKSKLAAIMAPFVHFAAIMPRFIFFRTSSGQAIVGKTVAALLPPSAFSFGMDLVGHYEGAGYGLTWANLCEDDFSAARVLLVLLADSLLYITLAWYFEQVVPSEYGAHQPPWFLFLRDYWCNYNPTAESAKYQQLSSTDVSEGDTEGDIEQYFSDEPHVSIHIEELRKVYCSGKVAVSGLTLDLFENQITALLGHNGAGKSTTISMLTGLIRPTSGDAHIWGYSICRNMNDIRRTIGVCPQQNVLFSYLTVKEHLELFATLKGVSKLCIFSVVEDMVMSLGFKDKENTLASSLSGGMQRKLQLGLAMIGGSRVVFLDEPTSGLDPQSRRSVWELLRSFKSGRAIVLTTHYMDEADLLCDRIAIMSEGQLQCCGSSLFLKTKFGVGYNLNMACSSPTSCSSSTHSAIVNLVQCHVSEAVLLSSAGGEISFQLPVASKAAFAELFAELESKLESLQIGSYGISMTTLEEVFLRLADKEQRFQECSRSNKVLSLDQNVDLTYSQKINTDGHVIKIAKCKSAVSYEKERSFGRAFGQMFKKRVIIARRDVKAFANSILLPVVAIVVVMLVMKLNIDPAGPKLQLNFDLYSSIASGRQDFPEKSVIPITGPAPPSISLYGGSKYVEFDKQLGFNNSIQLSKHLLDTFLRGPARFGALVFNDTLWPQVNTSALRNVDLLKLEKYINTATNTNISAQHNKNGTLGQLYTLKTRNGTGLLSPVTLLYNTTSDHSLPALVQEVAQARFRARINNSSATLRISSHPLPLTKNEALRVQTILTALAALFTLIPFSYCAASFAVFVVQERVVKAKLLQMVSGASAYSYWAATYAWDMVTYLVIVGITMLVLLLYQDQSFIGSWEKAGVAVSLLLAFGLAVIPLTYCYSFAFSNHANAQVFIAGIHFITGFGMLIGSIVMASLENTKEVNKHLVKVYQLFPPYNLGRGLANLAAFDLESLKGGDRDPYDWDVTGCSFALMLAEAVLFAILTLLIDADLLPEVCRFVQASFFTPPMNDLSLHESSGQWEKEDRDVSNERKRIEGGASREDTVVINRLHKTYPGQGLDMEKVAVRDLSLGIPPGQCFGFLGVNGAGKTTTLSILSGDLKPTSGDAFINGHSVSSDLAAAQKQMGYCPQFNPLLDFMTAREHLHMFASLKGVPSQNVEEVVTDLVESVGLQNYIDCVAGSYSGGNKRKLALAVALVGDPAVVFLDEPSSGMDPVTRRAMWNLIAEAVVEKKMSAVLTTHSMEECEALCGRVGVMVAGTLVCLGSIPHIKSRFGHGYTVELQCATLAAVPLLHKFMETEFPGAILEEQHMLRVKYCLPQKTLSLAHVFASLEREKSILGLEDYSVSQSTLEQVFLSLASRSTQPTQVLKKLYNNTMG